MKAIFAVNNKGYIGYENKMLWYCKEDFKHFRNMTDGQKLLVGYNTFLNLPKLKNREVIVDVKDNYNLNVHWVIGGKKTIEKYKPFINEIHISHINDESIGDVMAPDLSDIGQYDITVYHYYFGYPNKFDNIRIEEYFDPFLSCQPNAQSKNNLSMVLQSIYDLYPDTENDLLNGRYISWIRDDINANGVCIDGNFFDIVIKPNNICFIYLKDVFYEDGTIMEKYPIKQVDFNPLDFSIQKVMSYI